MGGERPRALASNMGISNDARDGAPRLPLHPMTAEIFTAPVSMYHSRSLNTDGGLHNTAVILLDSVMMFAEPAALRLPSPPDPRSLVAPNDRAHFECAGDSRRGQGARDHFRQGWRRQDDDHRRAWCRARASGAECRGGRLRRRPA